MTMDEARQIAAQAWCDPETSGIEMDVRLAEAFAKRLVASRSSSGSGEREATRALWWMHAWVRWAAAHPEGSPEYCRYGSGWDRWQTARDRYWRALSPQGDGAVSDGKGDDRG